MKAVSKIALWKFVSHSSRGDYDFSFTAIAFYKNQHQSRLFGCAHLGSVTSLADIKATFQRIF